MSEVLIQALQNPALYPHAVSGFEVIQTHLSWILLTGHYAYKIKKPLDLGFQDFTTLEKRKYYCELEVILNKRLAPQIYIEALPIMGSSSYPKLDGKGEAFEYAVKMHQFPQTALLSNLAKTKQLNKNIIEEIARQIATFHLEAPICSMYRLWGRPEEVFAPIQENFTALKQLTIASPFLRQILFIEQWATNQYHLLQTFLSQRKTNEYIRACHGDLHLGNMVLLDNKPVIFDCIEFNESFRWTDVMNDVGFLAMDLDHHALSGLGNLFVNKYLENTGDYQGTPLLRFYQCYRAMVRAKISALQLQQISAENPLYENLLKDLQDFLSLAVQYATSSTPTLTITFGVSGTGKTTYTESLLMHQGGIRLRSDILRKQMHGLSPNTSTTLREKQKIYSEQATQSLYYKLQALAQTLLQSGLNVIVDATCLKQWQRKLFIELAQQLQIKLEILAFEVPIDILQHRIEKRAILAKDASEADSEVLSLQLRSLEPLTEEERSYVKKVT